MLDEILYEQIVERKSGIKNMILRFLVIMLILLVAILGYVFIGFIMIIAAVVLSLLAYNLIFPRMNLEYIYDLMDHEMKFYYVFNKSKRKLKMTIDIQKAKKIVPASSYKKDSIKIDRTYNFTSRKQGARIYIILIQLGELNVKILFEPDEEMRARMRKWLLSFPGRDIDI